MILGNEMHTARIALVDIELVVLSLKGWARCATHALSARNWDTALKRQDDGSGSVRAIAAPSLPATARAG